MVPSAGVGGIRGLVYACCESEKEGKGGLGQGPGVRVCGALLAVAGQILLVGGCWRDALHEGAKQSQRGRRRQ
jgi:hypothetical protein